MNVVCWSQIRHFTASFHSQVIVRSADAIDSRADDMRRLNRTLSDGRIVISSLVEHQLRVVDAQHAGALADIRSFADDISARWQHAVVTSSTCTGCRLAPLADRVDASPSLSVTSLAAAADSMRMRSAELRAAWRTISATASDIWRRLVDDDLLRNFYLNIYNDISSGGDGRRQFPALRALLDFGRLPVPPALNNVNNGTGFQPSDLYAAFNADGPVTDFASKMAALDLDFRLCDRMSDAELTLSHRPDAMLAVAFRRLADRLVDFRSTECQLNDQLIRSIIDHCYQCYRRTT